MIHPPTVLLFLKAPRPGFVKTRLAATLGEEKACTVYREIAEKTFKKIPSNWSKTIYFTPTDAEPEMKDWLGDTPSFLPQSEGELGHRLLAACEETFTGGASGVILLGGDCPCITEKHLEECATEMASGKAVIGPAKDGGYWLLGLPCPCPAAFKKINWSTATVFQETLTALNNNHFQVHLLDLLEDVDDLPSYERAIQLTNTASH